LLGRLRLLGHAARLRVRLVDRRDEILERSLVFLCALLR